MSKTLKSALCVVIGAVAFVSLLAACGSSNENDSSPQSATSVSSLPSATLASGSTEGGIPPELIDRARTMQQLVYDGKYNEAYDFRSTRCNKGLSRDNYVTAASRDFPKGIGTNPKDYKYAVYGADRHARVQAYTPGHEMDTTSRWWIYEDGLWKFDNC